MQKQLRKPANWQDFETLCKKLWGEIWRVPDEIKKNGRPGQAQAGVDVYAIPAGRNGYWGIQCKGKDDYTNARLTKEEINNELKKSRAFTPALEGLIFATTANKDAAIEQYVRELDLASRQSGGSKILLFCWEDIADLIEENRDTYNWYLLEQKFATSYNFDVNFEQEGGSLSKELVLKPTFFRKFRIYELDEKIVRPQMQRFTLGEETIYYTPIPAHTRKLMALPFANNYWKAITNSNVSHALERMSFVLTNTGGQVIEDWRVELTFENGFQYLTDIVGGPGGLPAIPSLHTWSEGNQVGYATPISKPLVQSDTRSFEAHIVPLPQHYVITVCWQLIARDYSPTGELTLLVEPKYENKFEVETVASTADLREPELISVTDKEE